MCFLRNSGAWLVLSLLLKAVRDKAVPLGLSPFLLMSRNTAMKWLWMWELLPPVLKNHQVTQNAAFTCGLDCGCEQGVLSEGGLLAKAEKDKIPYS